MSFKDMLTDDIHNVFLNVDEFAEKRTVEYDGERYEDIPIIQGKGPAPAGERSCPRAFPGVLGATLRPG